MLGIFVIAGCILMAFAGPPISGYSHHGTLAGGRGQEYSGGYKAGGGFVGMKDSQGDYGDHGSSHRYTVMSGGSGHSSSAGSTYPSDSGYADSSIVGSHGSAYGAQTSSLGSPDSSGSLTSASYTASELGGQQADSSSELAGASYTTGITSSSGLSGYSNGGNGGNNHVGSGYSGYSEASPGGSSGNERVEYSSSHPSTSYVSYAVGGPKTSVYPSTSGGLHGSHGHGISSYSTSPALAFSGTGNHHAGISSSSSSSYPTETGRPVMSTGSGYSSGPSLSNFLASMQHGPSNNYIQHGSGSHRGTPGHHLFASASNPSPGYTSRGPGSGYFMSSSPYNRGSGPGKIIIVKESNGGHHHGGHMYPGEQQHGYGGGMFGGASTGYKIRNVGTGASHGPVSFTSGYNGGSSSHSNNNHAGSFFSFL